MVRGKLQGIDRLYNGNEESNKDWDELFYFDI